MPALQYKFPYSVNTELAITPEELDAKYFFGVDIQSGDGSKISRETKEYYIENAQKEIENFLEIKLNKQVIKENFDYDSLDYQKWGYIRTSYPVVKPFTMNGFINSIRQVEYPPQWLSSKKTNDPIGYNRHIYLVPSGAEAGVDTNNVIFNGIYPFVGYGGNRIVPNYWEVEYCTGFDTVPRDILDALGYLASIPLFAIGGDLILGKAGIASQSISIDNISQNIASTSSATNSGYGSRIVEYRKTLKEILPKLRDRYVGYKFMSM